MLPPVTSLAISILPEPFAVCRLPPAAPLPAWSVTGALVSVTRTRDELSIVCRDHDAPADVTASRGWRALQVAGPLDFALTGILLSIAAPLAQRGISIFAISTYDTDYVLVPHTSLHDAVDALTAAGHRVREEQP
jgi:uncharacterized protein